MTQDFQVRDTRFAALDNVIAAAKAVVHNWNEFGAEGGLQEYMEALEATLNCWNAFWPGESSHG